jgi:DNA-binding PadR family transcriptional regulator
VILVESMDSAEEVDGRVRSFDYPDCGFGGRSKSACSESAKKDRDSDESSEEVHGFLSGVGTGLQKRSKRATRGSTGFGQSRRTETSGTHLTSESVWQYSQSSLYRLSTMPKRKLDPLPAAAFQILLSLADEDLHGYGIMRQVEQQTNGRTRLGPGTLYSSIQGLVEEGLIEEVDRKTDAETDAERRRYYRLTSSGRKVARAEAERLADLLRVARAKKILRGEYV